jgi:hypothetical protein
MRILFDQGTPVPLRHSFGGHSVDTVYELGWAKLSNGDLLREAEFNHELLISTDQSIRYQQNLFGRRLAILILPTTDWRLIKPRAHEVATKALAMSPGEYQELEFPA